MMDNFYVELGRLIREKRLEKNLSTQELADKLGVSNGFISNLENAKTDTFNIDLMISVSNTLDISLLNFLPISEDTIYSNDILKPSQKKEVPETIKELLSENIDTIINNYLSSIKRHDYSKEFIAKITDKLLGELKYINDFKLK